MISQLAEVSASDMLRDGQLQDLNMLCSVQRDQITNLQSMLRRYKKDEEFKDSKSSRPLARKKTSSKKSFDQTTTAVLKKSMRKTSSFAFNKPAGEMEMTDFGTSKARGDGDEEGGSTLLMATQNPLAAASSRKAQRVPAATPYSPTSLRSESSASIPEEHRAESNFQQETKGGAGDGDHLL